MLQKLCCTTLQTHLLVKPVTRLLQVGTERQRNQPQASDRKEGIAFLNHTEVEWVIGLLGGTQSWKSFPDSLW